MTKIIRYYCCSCNSLFLSRDKYVRHRMSARKKTRNEYHKFLGIFFADGR